MSGLHEAFIDMAADVPMYGDLDRAIEQAERERRRRHGAVVGLAAAAAVLVVVAGVAAVSRDADTAPPVSPTPTPSPTRDTSPLPANGQITGAGRHLGAGADAPGYGWRAFDPVSGSGLLATGPDQDRLYPFERLEVFRPGRPVVTLTCGRVLQCSPDDTYLSFVATLGPGPDEVTVESGEGAAQVIGLDGATRRTLDLGATTADGARLAGLRWSPDGSRLAVLTAGRLGPSETTRVWLTDEDGDDAQLAYTAAMTYEASPGPSREESPDVDDVGNIWLPGWSWSWSPDGRTLLLDVRTPGTYGADVVALRLQPDGAGDPAIAETIYHSDRHFDWAGNLAWSPDGTRIAVRTEDAVTEISAPDGQVITHHPENRGWLIWPAKEG